MMKIKDVADKLNISPRAIRFYEEKGLISPAKQDNNQYRTMSIEDIKKAMAGVDQEDKEQLQYYLELQRSVIFSQWLEIKQIIDTTDKMIELVKYK